MRSYLRIELGLAFGIIFMMILVLVSTYVNENSSAYQTNTSSMISVLRYGKQYQQGNYIVITDDDITKYPRLKEALKGADLSYKMSSIFGRGAKGLLHVNSPYVMWLDYHDALAIINGLNFTNDESQFQNYSATVEYKRELDNMYYHISIKFQQNIYPKI